MFAYIQKVNLLVIHVQEAITSESYEFLRIDGNTKITEREKIVKVGYF